MFFFVNFFKTTSKKHVRETKEEKPSKQQKISKADIIEEHAKLLHDHELLKEEVRQLKADFESLRKEVRVCYECLVSFFPLFWSCICYRTIILVCNRS